MIKNISDKNILKEYKKIQLFSSDELTLVDIVQMIWFKKHIIIITTVLFTLLGILYAIHAKKIFTTNTIFVTKTANSSNSNLTNLASLAGISMAGNAGNVDPSDYLDQVIQDKVFLGKIMDKKWFYNGDSVFLEDIFEIKPDTIVDNWKYIFEKSKLDYIRKNGILKVVKDKKTGILTLTVNMPSPQLSYDVNNYVLERLSDYIRNAIQSQAKEKRTFIEDRIQVVKGELQKSENSLATFKERNILSSSPKVALEEMRLTRAVTLNQEIFIQFQKQFEIVRLEELNDQTLLQIIKNPEIPIKKSKPKRTQIAVLSFALGIVIGIGLIIFSQLLNVIRPPLTDTKAIQH